MANVFLESKARGDWWYEIEEGKIKVKYKIKFGFNEIPESHIKMLENNPGYQAKLARKTYKILNKKQALVADKTKEKVIDQAKELKQVKEVCKQEIAALKKDHEKSVKANSEDFKKQHQVLIDARGEALRELDKIKKENTSLKCELANIGEKHKKELDNMKAASGKEAEKFIKEKTVLENQIKDLKKQVTDIKAK